MVEEASAITRAGRFINETVAEVHGGIANERRDPAAFRQRSEFDLVASKAAITSDTALQLEHSTLLTLRGAHVLPLDAVVGLEVRDETVRQEMIVPAAHCSFE